MSSLSPAQGFDLLSSKKLGKNWPNTQIFGFPEVSSNLGTAHLAQQDTNYRAHSTPNTVQTAYTIDIKHNIHNVQYTQYAQYTQYTLHTVHTIHIKHSTHS